MKIIVCHSYNKTYNIGPKIIFNKTITNMDLIKIQEVLELQLNIWIKEQQLTRSRFQSKNLNSYFTIFGLQQEPI